MSENSDWTDDIDLPPKGSLADLIDDDHPDDEYELLRDFVIINFIVNVPRANFRDWLEYYVPKILPLSFDSDADPNEEILLSITKSDSQMKVKTIPISTHGKKPSSRPLKVKTDINALVFDLVKFSPEQTSVRIRCDIPDIFRFLVIIVLKISDYYPETKSPILRQINQDSLLQPYLEQYVDSAKEVEEAVDEPWKKVPEARYSQEIVVERKNSKRDFN